jgi:hypothetical protein
VEYGIANEMEQYDRKVKVRQMMGEASATPASKPSAAGGGGILRGMSVVKPK